MSVDSQALLTALQAVIDPNTGRDFVTSKALKNLQTQDSDVSFDVELGYPAKSQMPAFRKALIAAAKSVAGVDNVSVNMTMKITAHAVQRGVQVISIGFLIDRDEAMIWRGPMATQALEQLLRQTNWKDLDYLIVDMPPGTGDIQLTLSQRVPLTGAVIVTTPQDIALLDARKGIKMFEKVGVPILGIVENMAVHVCEKCGHTEHIFGVDGGKNMATEYGMDYLGALPLNMSIRVQADSGMPSVVADPDGEIAALYKSVARQLAIKIAAKAKDFSSKFPSIKISKET